MWASSRSMLVWQWRVHSRLLPEGQHVQYPSSKLRHPCPNFFSHYFTHYVPHDHLLSDHQSVIEFTDCCDDTIKFCCCWNKRALATQSGPMGTCHHHTDTLVSWTAANLPHLGRNFRKESRCTQALSCVSDVNVAPASPPQQCTLITARVHLLRQVKT